MSEPRTVDEAKKDIKRHKKARDELNSKVRHFSEAIELFEEGISSINSRIAELKAWIKEQESV